MLVRLVLLYYAKDWQSQIPSFVTINNELPSRLLCDNKQFDDCLDELSYKYVPLIRSWLNCRISIFIHNNTCNIIARAILPHETELINNAKWSTFADTRLFNTDTKTLIEAGYNGGR